MYTYLRLFIGIPLSQFNNKNAPSKSKSLINELAELTSEDLSMDRLEFFLDNTDNKNSLEVKNILNRLIEFRDNKILSEYKDLITEYKLDFKSDYHGADEEPLIFGFYIDKLLPVPAIGLEGFSEDINKIYQLRDKMKRVCYTIFGEKNFEDLNSDKLIGIFWNNHSS